MGILLLGGSDETAATEGEKLRGAAVWAEFIKFARARRGPYFSPTAGRTDDKLLRLACKLFPRGPPKEGGRCLPTRSSTETELADLYHQLLGRSVPTPLTRIWLGGGGFSLLFHLMRYAVFLGCGLLTTLCVELSCLTTFP